LVLPHDRIRLHHPGLQARRPHRRPGARQPDDPPSRRRAGEGHLRGQKDRPGLFRRVDVKRKNQAVEFFESSRWTLPICFCDGTVSPLHALAWANLKEETVMGFGRGALLWLLGVPFPIIILLALFWHH